MNKTYYFISGLPRSGSTILTAIFNQNPEFYSNITDQLYSCFTALVSNFYQVGIYNEVKEDNARKILLGLLNGFYADIDKKVIFNTNRLWTRNVDYLYKINPNFKIICAVRSFNEVLNSFEKLYKRRRIIDPPNTMIYGGTTSNAFTVWQRTDYLTEYNVNGFVRGNYEALREAYYGPYKDHLLLVDYNDLVRDTDNVVKKIYDFIEQPYYKHDYENLIFSNKEYDNLLQAPGLHDVRQKVECKEAEIVLPPEIWNKYLNWEFWK